MNRFRGKLIKTIRDTGSKSDDYSILPKIRQVLMHWAYEFGENENKILWKPSH